MICQAHAKCFLFAPLFGEGDFHKKQKIFVVKMHKKCPRKWRVTIKIMFFCVGSCKGEKKGV